MRLTCVLFLLFFMTGVKPCAAQDYHLSGNEVRILKPVLFETGTARLKPESDITLAIIKKYLDDKRYISLLRVECHTDNSGDATFDQLLSEQQALSVCRALAGIGVDCKRLIATGFGSKKPLDSNDTPDGKAINRRVSFINAALLGRPIGGMPVDGGGSIAGDPCK